MTAVPGRALPPARLRFDPAIQRTATDAFKGMSQYGPYDNAAVDPGPGSLLFVYPEGARAAADDLAKTVFDGVGSYRGFARVFGVPVRREEAISSLVIPAARGSEPAAAVYRDQIRRWQHAPRPHDPRLAVVIVPHSERSETGTPYYAAKAAFADLGIASQMVTRELLADANRKKWAAADIALASFAKLGGVPWLVEAPPEEDLVLGVGRREIGPEGDRRPVFGYAVALVSNGAYRQTWSVTPAADPDTYQQRLTDAVAAALAADTDQATRRIVVHLAKQTRLAEIEAVEEAMRRGGVDLPVAFLRIDDSSLWDLADTDEATFAPAKGTVVSLGPTRALLQSSGLTNLGPPDGPLLVTMDRRSTVDVNAFDGLVEQALRLAHANWRGFQARSRPATLAYGEQLADLVGHMTDAESWNPDRTPPDLARRPWFL